MKAIVATVTLAALVLPSTASAHHSIAHNKAQTYKVVRAVFGPYRTTWAAMRVTRCETGGIYNAYANNPATDVRGNFQIQNEWIGKKLYWNRGWGRPIFGMVWKIPSNLYNRWNNAITALYLSHGGRNWFQWAPVCRP